MKELRNSLAQLMFVIMAMITLAVSTAALSEWASPDAGADGNRMGQSSVASAITMGASAKP